MALPSRAKAACYQKALPIGAFLFLFQMAILIWVVFSRALGADTFHALLDVLTLAGTTYLFRQTWKSEEEFERYEHRWLLVGVISLGLGGIMVGIESASCLLKGTSSTPPPAWPLLIAALVGAIGNWRMHHLLGSVEDAEHDHLHKNNLDHVFWDMILSFAVLCSGCSMLLFATSAIDSWIATVVGFIILPYLALKRWKEGVHEHAHHH